MISMGWQALLGEGRIRPWRSLWSMCKDILREGNFRSIGKLEDEGVRLPACLVGWRSLTEQCKNTYGTVWERALCVKNCVRRRLPSGRMFICKNTCSDTFGTVWDASETDWECVLYIKIRVLRCLRSYGKAF